jgi:hypothetical protein
LMKLAARMGKVEAFQYGERRKCRRKGLDHQGNESRLTSEWTEDFEQVVGIP